MSCVCRLASVLLLLSVSLVGSAALADTSLRDEVSREAQANLRKLCDQIATVAVKHGVQITPDSVIPMVCSTEASSLTEATHTLVSGDGELPFKLSSQERKELMPAIQNDFVDEGTKVFQLVPDTVDLVRNPSWEGVNGVASKLFGQRSASSRRFVLFAMNAGVRVSADALKTVVSIAQGLSFKSVSSAATSGVVTLVKAPFKTVGGGFRIVGTLMKFVKSYLCMGAAEWLADGLPKVNDAILVEYEKLIDRKEVSASQYRSGASRAAHGLSEEERTVLAKAEEIRATEMRKEMQRISRWLLWLPHCSRIVGKACGAAIAYIDLNTLTGAKPGSSAGNKGDLASLALTGLCWYGGPTAPACGTIYAASTEIMTAWRTGNNDLNQCLGGFGWKVDAWAVKKAESLAGWRYGASTRGIDEKPRLVKEAESGQTFEARECCVCRQRFYSDGYLRDRELGSVNALGVIEADAASDFEGSSCKHQEDKGYSDDLWVGSLQKYARRTPKVKPTLRDGRFDYYRYTDCRRVVVMGGACSFPTDKGRQFDRRVWDEGRGEIWGSTLVAPTNDTKRPLWMR